MADAILKRCCTCKDSKPLCLFPKSRSQPDGYKRRCKDCNNKANRDYRARHPEASAASTRNWQKNNPEKARAKMDRWKAKNPGRHEQLVRDWKERNAERLKSLSKEYVARPDVRIHRAIRQRLKNLLGCKRNRTFQMLGYSRDQLMEHLERQFVPGMTWGNYGEWHIDHIIPLVSFEINGVDDPAIRHAWCLTNLRPLWASENMSKRDKILYLI